jgi:hypothetical protein
MGRPLKADAERAEIERHDTMYWCGLAKAHSGLSDAEIEHRVSNLAGLNSKQIKARLKSVVYPSGRNFNRWLNGKRSMNHDAIQLFVNNARKVGLLPQRKMLQSHLDLALERRALPTSSTSAKFHLKTVFQSLKELHAAKRELNEAALKFQKCAINANKTAWISIYDDTSVVVRSGEEFDTLDDLDLELITQRVSNICNWYELNGEQHDLS